MVKGEPVDLKDSEEVVLIVLLVDILFAASMVIAGVITIAYAFHVSENIAIRAFVFIGGAMSYAIGRIWLGSAIGELKARG